MSKARVFGAFRPRLNIAPLLLTPGFAAIGYAVRGSQGAWWAVAAWLAVVLGASGTWLSFGLLALSSTPALHAFGLTLLFGILIVGIAAPLYRPRTIPLPNTP